MGPIFLKPTNIEPLVDFCASVALQLQIFLFLLSYSNNFWDRIINEGLFGNRTKKFQLAGIKYTQDNLVEMQHCNNVDGGNDDFQWI